MRATRYGSSPNVSSVRPQRGSRQTSSTGARPWCAPTARICTRIESPSARASSGLPGAREADRLREDGRLAGPSGRSRSPRGRSPGCRAASPRRGGAGSRSRAAPTPAASSELAPEIRVTWPRPLRQQRLGALGREPPSRRELEDPGAAELRDLLVARHPREQVVDALGDASARVAVERRGRCRSGDGHASPRPARHEPRTTSRVGSMRVRREARAARRSGRSGARTASKPMRWIGCSIVVSGGSQSADSGTLSKPITERSSGTASPSERATAIVSIADDVVGGEDRGRPVGCGQQQLARRLLARTSRLVAADADERRVELDARPLRSARAVAALAQLRGLEVGAAGEEADPAVAEPEQVLGRRDRAAAGCPSRRSAGRTSRRCGRRRRPARRRSTSTLLGVTRIAPSQSVPLTRER